MHAAFWKITFSLTTIVPQQDKTAATPPRPTLQGKIYEPSDRATLVKALELAVDYRGDVNVVLKDGRSITGFLYTFEEKADLVHLFAKTEGKESVPEKITASDIKSIQFSGDDIAFGKSWDDWSVKSEAARKAEAERAEVEAKKLGIL